MDYRYFTSAKMGNNNVESGTGSDTIILVDTGILCHKIIRNFINRISYYLFMRKKNLPVPPSDSERFKVDKSIRSYFFIGSDGKKWHTRLHIIPSDYAEFMVKIQVTILALLQNPSYMIPNPYARQIMKQLQETFKSEDPEDTRYIG